MSDPVEVVDDFKADLQFLVTNDRYAINNFTVIAKESVQYADAISNVLIDHISKCPPNHKLLALYVLDSIAKNIGTPYTLFLGHRLYSTFMDAYSLVDAPTRRKLDEMLKTWKSPVPGSSDPRPVFHPDITKRIEGALMQVRNRAMQHDQQQQRAQQEMLRRRTPVSQPQTQWRSTPTPPQNDLRYPAPSNQGYVQYPGFGENAYNQAHVTQLPQHQSNPSQQNYPPPSGIAKGNINLVDRSGDLEAVKQDLDALIAQNKAEFAKSLSDEETRTRLMALLKLQSILNEQQLPPDQLHAVRTQINLLKQGQRSQNLATVPLANGLSESFPLQLPSQHSTPAPPFLPQPPAVGANDAQFYQGAGPSPDPPPLDFLANLLASASRSRTPQSSYGPFAPPQLASVPALPSQTPRDISVAAENPLISQLKASGLLSSLSPAPSAIQNNGQNSAPRAPPAGGAAPANNVSPASLLQLLRVSRKEPLYDVQLTSASLKKYVSPAVVDSTAHENRPRPSLISNLYETRSNQCLTCGRRFLGTEEGKGKKARHLDWHFKTNQRLVDAAQRGQGRSWYVDELEWIKSRDFGEDDEGATMNGTTSSAKAELNVQNEPKERYIRVPNNHNSDTMPCPICQELFKPSWSEELQDFVYQDAVKIGETVYHASCYSDYRKDERNTPVRVATPNSVLGKRKNEGETENPSPAKHHKDV